MEKVYVGLCIGRHDIPDVKDGYIFNSEVNPLDIDGLNKTVKIRFAESKPEHINLYVTGLSVALVAVINYCLANKIRLTLYHYDRDTASYYPQEVCIPL